MPERKKRATLPCPARKIRPKCLARRLPAEPPAPAATARLADNTIHFRGGTDLRPIVPIRRTRRTIANLRLSLPTLPRADFLQYIQRSFLTPLDPAPNGPRIRP